MRGFSPSQWIEKKGVATLSDLVEAITGERLRGSWWAHPKGRAIFAAGEQLGDSPDVLVCKLVDGKVTFVHRRFFAPVYRLAHREDLPKLSKGARQLLDQVRRSGLMRVAGRKAELKVLEGALLVRTFQEHTARGAHATVAESWEHWASDEVKHAAARLSRDEAVAALRSVCAMASLAGLD